MPRTKQSLDDEKLGKLVREGLKSTGVVQIELYQDEYHATVGSFPHAECRQADTPEKAMKRVLEYY